MRYRYIAVDGPIGAGKTTLVKMLAEDFAGTAIFEPAEKNPFLPEFYKDRKRNAFTTQLFFMLSRFRQQEELKQMGLFDGKPIVCDYTFIKDHIFADINLNPDEKNLYDVVFNLLVERLPYPDLIVYLRSDPKTLLQRIGKRGISYEKGINIEYLEDVAHAYDSYFLNYNKSPLLVVDTTMINFDRKVSDYELLKKEIANHRGGVVHVAAR